MNLQYSSRHSELKLWLQICAVISTLHLRKAQSSPPLSHAILTLRKIQAVLVTPTLDCYYLKWGVVILMYTCKAHFSHFRVIHYIFNGICKCFCERKTNLTGKICRFLFQYQKLGQREFYRLSSFTLKKCSSSSLLLLFPRNSELLNCIAPLPPPDVIHVIYS